MKFFLNFILILEGPGEAYVESRGHEDLITLDTYVQQGKTIDNKFYIYVKTLASLAIWGPGGGGGGGGGLQ